MAHSKELLPDDDGACVRCVARAVCAARAAGWLYIDFFRARAREPALVYRGALRALVRERGIFEVCSRARRWKSRENGFEGDREQGCGEREVERLGERSWRDVFPHPRAVRGVNGALHSVLVDLTRGPLWRSEDTYRGIFSSDFTPKEGSCLS